MLFQALSTHPDLWSLYHEGQGILNRHFEVTLAEGQSPFVPGSRLDDPTATAIRHDFFNNVGNLEAGHQWASRAMPLIIRDRLSGRLRRLGSATKAAPIRMVDKSPGNSYRIQVLDRVFPDGRFVHIVRDPRTAIASIYHAWTREPRFQAFDLPPGFTIHGYEGRWCFAPLPNLSELNGLPLVDVCAAQWISYNEHCLRDLPSDPARVLRVRYEDLLSSPGTILEDLARWADIDPLPLKRFEKKLPVVNTWTKPRPDKWRRYEDQIDSVRTQLGPMGERLGYAI